MNRRQFVRRSILSSPFVLGGTMGYARYIERHAVEVVEQELNLGLESPLTVALLGDFHFDPLFEVDYIETVVAKVNATNPDLILLGGDYVSHSANRLQALVDVLATAKARLGTFGILGNHEFWMANHATGADAIANVLDKAGIRILRNESVPIPGVPDCYLTGFESFWSGNPNSKSLEATPTHARHLVLAHEPDSFDKLTDPRIVLQMSGHTHGGQIRVPFAGAIILPTWGKKYEAGLYERGTQRLYVNRGIGTVGQHYRLNCRPEITLFRLR
ncbi:MAG TPA: metallophosphoesterase [Gemmataceae bacterium]|jgi:hypothetical protein|nr:metallophosphoesterase [Gemmataceae bacterium]